MFDLLTEYKVHSFVADLLKKRFPNDRIRQAVLDSGDKLNFACPYCGDSKTDAKKKRGNLYPTRGFYKCYNDGCSVKVDIPKFVSHFALKYGLGVPDVTRVDTQWTHQTSVKKRGSLIELLLNKRTSSSLLQLDEIVERFALTLCKDADPDSQVGQFVQRRHLTSLPIFDSCCYFDSRDDKIYLFNLDLKSRKIVGFAVRRINSDSYGPKYLIKTYSELKKTGLIKGISEETLADIDTINNYFNVFNINFTKPIYVTEGQIDAMFLKNAIATTGVSKSKLLLENLLSKSNALIFFDSDLAGKKQSIELIKKGYKVFLWNKVMADLRVKHKDSSAEIRALKDVNDLFIFMKSKDNELDFEKFNKFVAEYFSESALDLLYV
jgi:hypothetical protein